MAFGKSTPTFLQMTGLVDESASGGVLDTLQAPALCLALASVGSFVFCATTAGQKNRNPWIWALKGIFGGPAVIWSLQESDILLTQAEAKKQGRP